MIIQYFSKAEHVWGVGLGAGDRAGVVGSGLVDWNQEGKADCSSASSPPCTLYRGDQSDPAFLARLVANTGGNFTVVVDDGSHLPSHQLLTLETLWPSLAPGGLYIVEDVETRCCRVIAYNVKISVKRVMKTFGEITKAKLD